MTEIRAFHVEIDPPGKRLYQIRLACGDGHRKAEPIRAFVKRVKRLAGTSYLESAVSMLERDAQGWRLKDLYAFAAADPKQRGPVWLGFGDAAVAARAAAPPQAPDTPKHRPMPIPPGHPAADVKPARKKGSGGRT